MVYVTYMAGLHLYFKRWGTTNAEWTAVYPGDYLLPRPTYSNIRAITINAPPSAIMPWLKQLGIHKGGLYSYDWLENAIGLPVHSATRILPQYQSIKLGDTLLLGPMGGPQLVDWRANQFLIYYSQQTNGFQNIWSFHLHPQRNGSTRLITVYRMAYAPTITNFLIWRLFVEPVHFIMERKMLYGIKDRAEGKQL